MNDSNMKMKKKKTHKLPQRLNNRWSSQWSCFDDALFIHQYSAHVPSHVHPSIRLCCWLVEWTEIFWLNVSELWSSGCWNAPAYYKRTQQRGLKWSDLAGLGGATLNGLWVSFHTYRLTGSSWSADKVAGSVPSLSISLAPILNPYLCPKVFS